MLDKNEGPVHGPANDPGKGTATIPPNDGDLIKGFTDAYTVRGDTKSFGEGTSNPGEATPAWLEGRSVDKDATNSMGSISGDTGSDPMFDKFKHETTGMPNGNKDNGGSNSAESVASQNVASSGNSTPMFEKFADEQKL